MDSRDVVRTLLVGRDPTRRRHTKAALQRADDRLRVRETDVDAGVRVVDDDAVELDCVVVLSEESDDVETLREIHAARPALPVVFATADQSLARAALASGATEVSTVDESAAERTVGCVVLAHRVNSVVTGRRASTRATETERLSSVFREVTQRVVEATTREEVEDVVCSALAGIDRYRFTWFARHAADTDEVDPTSWAGGGADYLDDLTVTADERASGRGPVGQSIQARSVVVSQDVREDPAFEPWREGALEHDFHAAAAVPVTYEETLYGVLAVYADRTWAFDETERALLSDLGETVGHAIHAVEVRERFRRFSEAVEHAGHAIYITDVDGTIEYVNPAFEAATGYAAEEAIGENPRILKSGEYDDRFYERLWRTILDGNVWRGYIVNRRRNGDRYHVEQTIAPITDEEGDITHFVAVNNDITELKEHEAALARQNERLEAFTRIVSHDIRNPLNVASGRLNLVRETGDQSHLDACETALDRIDQLLEDLLSLARAGREIGDVGPVDLETLARDAWGVVETGEATLDVAIDGKATLCADASRLRQIFENLFRNAVEHGSTGNQRRTDDAVEHGSTGNRQNADDAVEHGSTGTTVRVGTAAGGFYVEDDGPGIPPDERDRIFETGHSTSEQGCGLGLAIVERVASAHGWSVQVTEGTTGGARFEFDEVTLGAAGVVADCDAA